MMALLNNIVIILLIVLKSKNSYCLRNFVIHWHSVSCKALSKPHFGYFNCSIHEYPRNRGDYVSAHIQFSRDIEKVLLDFKVSMPGRRKKDKDVDLIKFRSDGCIVSKRNSANPVITAFLKQLYQSANFPTNCPLKANNTYNVDNLSLNPDFFPGYTPEMNFSLQFSMFTNRIHLLTAHLMASIINKK